MVISPPIEAANLGMADSLILMVLALVVFGPRRLPQIGRQIGKLMYEFRKASNDFKFQMEEELRNAEAEDRRKKDETERKKALQEAQDAATMARIASEKAMYAAAQAQSAAEVAQTAVQDSAIGIATGYEAAAEETPAAETGLRVKPPSTGEQVAAERPGRASVDAAELPPTAETAMKEHVAAEDAASEPTAHHG